MAPAGLLFVSCLEDEIRSHDRVSPRLDGVLLLEPLVTAPHKATLPCLTAKQLQQLTHELVFHGLHSAQQLSIDEGVPLLLIVLQALEQALMYGSREDIQTALDDLATPGQCIAALDKVVGRALGLLDEGGGAYMHGQAARLLEVGAAFATRVLGKHALAAWQDKERGGGGPSRQATGPAGKRQQGATSGVLLQQSRSLRQQGLPGRQSRAASAEVTNLCHHLQTIRKLQAVVGKRLASDYSRQMESPETDAQPAAAAADLLALTLRQGGGSNGNLRVVDMPGLQPSAWEGGPSLANLDWSLPGERVLSGQGANHMKQTEASGSVVAPGSRAIEPVVSMEDERPGDMVARWGREDSPPEVVVRDALRAGRLALAVAYLQRQRSAGSSGGRVFQEIRGAGRRLAFAYFRAGNTATALLALRRLGEDTEVALRELAMGSLDRGIRNRAAAELRETDRLGKQEARALRILNDLEAAYPEASFWQAYRARSEQAAVSAVELAGRGLGLHLPVSDHPRGTSTALVDVKCGEVGGAVVGEWGAFATAEESEDDKEREAPGNGWYLCLAADWVSRWERVTIERIYLERGLALPSPISWQAQLQYHVAHHNWSSVEPLLEHVPAECVEEGVLRVKRGAARDIMNVSLQAESSPEEQKEDLYVPGVKLLLVDVTPLCTNLMRELVEEKLARQHVFLHADWDGTPPFLRLLARAHLLFAPATREGGQAGDADAEGGSEGGAERRPRGGSVYMVYDPPGLRLTPVVGAHPVVVRHCAEQGLPHLLQMYLDWHSVGRDPTELEPLQVAAGQCEWAHWLLLSRLPGEEYAASFSNARVIAALQVAATADTAAPLPATLDEMAQREHELRAVATLIHAPVPLEECLDGSADSTAYGTNTADAPRNLPSWYCRLGSLTRGLHAYPTLCKMLERASGAVGQPKLEDAPGLDGFWRVARLDAMVGPYVRWRQSLFATAARDASLLSLLPPGTSPAVRRVVEATVVGPTRLRPTGESSSEAERVTEWEDAAEEMAERELSQHTLEQPRGIQVEQLLKQGRPMAAMESLLKHREEAAAQEGVADETQSGPGSVGGNQDRRRSRASRGRARRGGASQERRLQSRRRGSEQDGGECTEAEHAGWEGRLRDPLTDDEFASVLKQAVPLAVRAFDDTRVTSACCAFLELCGVSVAELRVDLAALRRVREAEVGREAEDSEQGLSADLASGLSDAYAASIEGMASGIRKVPPPQATCPAVVDLLAQLEAVSLSMLLDSARASSPEQSRWGRARAGSKERGNAGAWLRTGAGDNYRTSQMEAAERWELVTAFCTAHGVSPSEAYLQQLAREDDWLGFLAEAQKEGTALERLMAITAESFSDAPLREHVLIVLRSLRADLGPASAAAQPECDQRASAPELFATLADCEKQPQPGAALLEKARGLGWPLLAIVASSYEGGDALPCLATWLATTVPGINARGSREAAALVEAVDGAVRKLNSEGECAGRVKSGENEEERRPHKRRCTAVVGGPAVAAKLEAGHFILEIGGNDTTGSDLVADSLVESVGQLCGRALFLPLLRGLELFTPASSLVHFVRGLQAATRFNRAGAVAHFQQFGRGMTDSNREEAEGLGGQWAARAATAAADAVLSTCPADFERQWLLEILAEVQEWGHEGADASRYRLWSLAARLCPALPLDQSCTPEALIHTLGADGKWDGARDIAQQFDRSAHQTTAQNDSPATARGTARAGDTWAHSRLSDRVSLLQAEALLSDWQEWRCEDQAERLAIWGHCSALFEKHSLPAAQAGDFFSRHAEELKAGDPSATGLELHTCLLLCVQWLSGIFSATGPVAEDDELSALEGEVWRAAIRADQAAGLLPGGQGLAGEADGDHGHVQGAVKATAELWPAIEASQRKRKRAPSHGGREAASGSSIDHSQSSAEPLLPFGGNFDADAAAAVSALLEDGRVAATRALLHHLHVAPPDDFPLVEAAECVAAEGPAALPPRLATFVQEKGLHLHTQGAGPRLAVSTDRSGILRDLAELCPVDEGRGHILRLGAVSRAAAVLSLGYGDAAKSTPLELLQLLALQAGRPGALSAAEQLGLAYEGRRELPAWKVARVLAECFQKGLLAAHKGGYLGDGPAEEAGPAPLLWKPEDFVQWAAVCPEAPQVGHALMRLVIGGKSDLPPPCEAELLILAHRFYTSSACFDGLDVLSALTANRATAYLAEDKAAPVARLLVGTGDFVRLRTLADALVEAGHLDLLLTTVASHTALRGPLPAPSTARAVLLASLSRMRSDSSDSEYEEGAARVDDTLGALYESASSLERRATAGVKQAAAQRDISPTALGRLTPTQAGTDKELLKAMELYVQAAETWSQLEAGSAAARCSHQAALVALQLRLPDVRWLDLTPDAARRLFVEQAEGFAEALVLAQAYHLMDPLEWAQAVWNQVMWQPLIVTERYLADFASTLPLAPPLLMELARAYRAEVTARDEDMSRWLPSGAGGAESGRHLGKAFKALLDHVGDVKLRLQLATLATGFADVVDDAIRLLDKVPETAGPLILRKGHGGTYVPLM